MNKYVHLYAQAVKSYFRIHKKDITTAVPIVVTVAVLIGVVVFATVHNMPNIVYQPIKSCSLLTPAKAEQLLGDKVINTEKNDPVISGDTAISKCAYSDENPDQNSMAVAAIAVRSAINDNGIAQTKADFAASKPKTGIEIVSGVGDSAYFNQQNGQLNVLKDREWLIVSYGVGSEPETNTVEKAVQLVKLVLH
jgi:hypothetical protein